MAKSKNHTAHNQSYKAHRNGIKKVKKTKYTSTKGVRLPSLLDSAPRFSPAPFHFLLLNPGFVWIRPYVSMSRFFISFVLFRFPLFFFVFGFLFSTFRPVLVCFWRNFLYFHLCFALCAVNVFCFGQFLYFTCLICFDQCFHLVYEQLLSFIVILFLIASTSRLWWMCNFWQMDPKFLRNQRYAKKHNKTGAAGSESGGDE